MASAESYVFRSFLKTIILVILLGAVHGLVILPVLLTLFHCGDSEKKLAEHRGEQQRAALNLKSKTFSLGHQYHPHPVYPKSDTDSDIYRISSATSKSSTGDFPLSQVSTVEMDYGIDDGHFGMRPRLPADWISSSREMVFRHANIHR
jgi:hypothetical protein